jgi:hypothetical protein
MAFSFKVTFKDANSALANAKQAVENSHGSFSGDTARGHFVGKTPVGSVTGDYRVISGTEAEITITDKPTLLGQNTVKNAVKKFFA